MNMQEAVRKGQVGCRRALRAPRALPSLRAHVGTAPLTLYSPSSVPFVEGGC